MVRTSLLLAFALLFALFPGGAEAADVSISGATLTFAADQGEANALTQVIATVPARLAGGTLTVRVPGARVPAGTYCVVVTTSLRGRRTTLARLIQIS